MRIFVSINWYLNMAFGYIMLLVMLITPLIMVGISAILLLGFLPFAV